MACITQGFKKCGIYPLDPNAIDKTLLFRGGNDINPDDLDLSLNDEPTNESEVSAIEDNTTYNTENEPENIVSAMPSTSNTGVINVMNLEVGADGVLSPIIHTTSEATQSSNEIEPSSTTICPPELALSAIESVLTAIRWLRDTKIKQFTIRPLLAVGMHHYGRRELSVGSNYHLEAEPLNKYDSNAVAIYDGSRKVGNLKREYAAANIVGDKTQSGKVALCN
ncbi:Hypothetical predicted protein [Mytilus galloprovincialis]|uniref:HIRAN domain-containing protein n=1 Tax=Mytilus galloprovincialis TaxID=29158 RepID=A0A8B6EVF5_MYTGA|nr:Hypothetical predicted protein [Mytilus galloprovincialis]